VDKLDGSPEAKKRLMVILETMTGICRTLEACERLGICEQRFDQIRIEGLQAALTALEHKPVGRKPRQPSADEEAGVPALRKQIAQLEAELSAALIRAEVAIALPQVGAADQKKTTMTNPPRSRRSKKSS
jgi:hypothetical protein